jgi:hypothetical protein
MGDPVLAGMAGLGLDSQDQAFTRANYISGNSTLSRIDKQHDLARKSIINRLAARGLLNSGETGYQEGEEGKGYGQNLYSARLSLLNYLSQLFAGNPQAMAEIHKQITGGQLGAAPVIG